MASHKFPLVTFAKQKGKTTADLKFYEMLEFIDWSSKQKGKGAVTKKVMYRGKEIRKLSAKGGEVNDAT